MQSETPTPAADPALIQKKNPGIVAYIAFALAVAFFSGLLITDKWWGIFDYTVLLGDFGSVVAKVTDKGGEISTVMSNFRGKGGSGAIDGFMFALALVPTIMLATAMIAVFEYYGALNAAERLLNPIIASLQSTDAGAVLTRTLKESGDITERETLIFAAFQMTAGAAIGNFLSSGIVFFSLRGADGSLVVPTTIGTCLGIILLGKVLSANLTRLVFIREDKKAHA